MDGTGLRRLDGSAPDSTMIEADPAWSPDGTKLAVEAFDGDATTVIHILDAESGEVVWEVEGRFPDW